MTQESNIQFRQNTAALATSSNPILNLGEPGYETDTGYLKIGDGVTVWNSLPYVSVGNADTVGGKTASQFNQVIGTDTDINTSGSTIIDSITVTDGVITTMGTRILTLADLGYTGETGATGDQSASEILTLLKTVDGAGSGLDADLLDTHSSAYFATADHTHADAATETYVNTQIANLVDASPATLDTLNELAAALGDDPNFATTIATSIGTKLDATANAVSATKLATARTFDIIGDITATGVTFDGTSNVTITAAVNDDSHNHVMGNVDELDTALAGKLPIGSNAVSATKLATSRTISLSGDATGSIGFDGTANVTIPVVIADDSHNHIISNVDGLQTALDAKLSTTGTAYDSDRLDGILASGYASLYGAQTFNGTQTIGADGTALNLSANISPSNGIGIEFVPLIGETGILKADHNNSTAQGGDFSFQFSSDQSKTNVILDGTGNFIAGTNPVWHSGNDGEDSGLDADLLDGNHASAFATASGLSSHISDTTTHGATGAIMGTTNTQTVTNKTINSSNNTISIHGGTL